MNVRAFSAAGLALGIMLSTSALAATTDTSSKAIYDLGRCVVKADRGAAVDLMQNLPVTPAQATLHSSSLGRASKCLAAGPVSVQSTTLRGAMAQALLLRDFPRVGVPPKMSQDMFAKFDLPLDAAKSNADERTVNLYKLADCVARNQGIKLERLFRAEVGSGVESRLIDYLGPTISACQGSAGTLRISRDDFRSLLAQAAYNVSVRYWSGELWSAS
jgi:hypothetical protein